MLVRDPVKNQIITTQAATRDLWWLRDNPEKLINLNPASKDQKFWNLVPKHQKTLKFDNKINRLPTPAKGKFLHHFSYKMLAFQPPHDQIQTTNLLANKNVHAIDECKSS